MKHGTMVVANATRIPGLAAVLFSALVNAGHSSVDETGRVRYQQDWLARRSGAFHLGEQGCPLVYRRGEGDTAADDPDFDDPRSVFEFVLSNAPQSPTVFPSELYYYYEFALGERIVSGNLRFTEADEGVINIGYFDRLDRSAMRWAGFSSDDGVEVRMSEDRTGVTVTSGETSRTFSLYQGAFGNEADIALVPGERYVSGILDESGYFFHLIYSDTHRAFYYVLQTNKPLPEPHVRLERVGENLPDGVEVLLGADSRFVFIRDNDLGRTVLVAVNVDQTAANTYYDGPFDQVPPKLPIRTMLETAYPYVAYGEGIDEHGRFLGKEGQRVAISPYFDYKTFDDVKGWLEKTIDSEAEGVDRWIRAVLESKRYFHLRLNEPSNREENLAAYSHEDRTSHAWPAGHWVPESSTWPSDEPKPSGEE